MVRTFRGWRLAALLLLTACAQPPAAPAPDVLATWNGGELRVADLDAFLLGLPLAERLPAEGQEPAQWLEQKLHRLFERRVLATPAALSEAEADPSFAGAFAQHSRQLLGRVFLERHNANFEVHLDEVRAYFEQHRAQLGRPEQRGFRNLLLAFPEGATAAEQDALCARVEELRAQVVAGASFEELVYRHSQSANAAAGGLVGPITRADLRPEAAELVFSLEAGEVSRVLRNRAGCQLLQVVNIAPAIRPELGLLQDQIVQRLAEQKRQQWFRGLLGAQAERFGVRSPAWLYDPQAPLPPPDEVIVELAGERLTGRDVAAAGSRSGQLTPAAAAQVALGDLLFSAALRRDDPAEAERLLTAGRQELAYGLLRRRAVSAFLSALPEDLLRQHYETLKDQLMSDPQVELTLYAWPLGAGDPLDALRRPRAFAAAVQAGEPAGEVWSRLGTVPGARQERLPQTSVRELVRRRPELSHALLKEAVEGEVVGPYRSGDRLYVVRVETAIPPRQLSFLEVRERVVADYAREHGAQLEEQWFQRLAQEHGLRVVPEHLQAFGLRLVEGLQGAPG